MDDQSWHDLRVSVDEVYRDLSAALRTAREHLLTPSSPEAAQNYVRAWGELHHAATITERRLAAILAMVQADDPPARPLEVVLGEIQALGHEYDLFVAAATDSARITTSRSDVRWNSPGEEWDEEKHRAWDAYAWLSERGDVVGESATEVAQRRLDDIVKLRAQRAEQAAALEILVAGLTPGWRVRKTTEDDLQAGRFGDWLVVRPDGAVVNGFDEPDTRAYVEERNRTAILAAIAARAAREADPESERASTPPYHVEQVDISEWALVDATGEHIRSFDSAEAAEQRRDELNGEVP